MTGGSYVVYTGARRQRGGGFLSSFKGTMAPVGQSFVRGAKLAGRHVVTGAKYAGRQALQGAKYAGRQALQGAKYAGKNLASGMRKASKNEAVQEIARQAVQKGSEIAASAAVDALQGRNLDEALRERSREVALNTITGQSSNNTKATPSRKRKKLKQKGNPTKKRRVTPSASTTRVVVVKKKTRKKRKTKRIHNNKGRFSRALSNKNNLF